MIKVKVNNEYKDVVKIFCGGTLQQEITKVWSREANDHVYLAETIIEYTGSLPITISANGDALIAYRIYGASGGVGVATGNLVDFEAWLIREDVPYTKDGKSYTITGSLNKLYSNPYYFSNTDIYVSISGSMTIPTGSNIRIYIVKRDGTISGSIALGGDANIRQTLKVLGAGIKFDYTRAGTCTVNNLMLNSGSPASPYEPYGHKLPMVVHSELKDISDTVSVNGDLWDIVNYNNDFTRATLLRYEVMPDMVYSAKQAIFAFPNGLAAGDYHFTVAQHSWVSTDVGKTLTFTLTQAIPEGGQLVLNGAYNTTLVGTTISSYASPTTTTATETVTMTEGDSGTSLGSLTNAGTPDSNINSLQKALLGANEWKTSALRQYLNSDKTAGSVWTPQTIYDRPPAWATNMAGFMVGLDEDFLSCVADTTYVTVRNTVSDGGGTDTLTDKFYLPSRTEIFGSDEIANTPEGTLYQYYVNATNADRIKYHANKARSWRLRTPSVVVTSTVRIVSTTGALNNYAGSALGFAPACQIDLTKLSNPWLQNNMYKVRTTTTPIYIGENQLDAIGEYRDYVDFGIQKIARKIREYTFTGNETFNLFAQNAYGTCWVNLRLYTTVAYCPSHQTTLRSSHFTAINNSDAYFWYGYPQLDDACNFEKEDGYDTVKIFFRSTANFSTAEECKAYFKEQYDNGTPVKIWFVMKYTVGQYESTDNGKEDPPVPLPEIPTIKGETVIDYDGDPKPSQMYIKYKAKR